MDVQNKKHNNLFYLFENYKKNIQFNINYYFIYKREGINKLDGLTGPKM